LPEWVPAGGAVEGDAGAVAEEDEGVVVEGVEVAAWAATAPPPRRAPARVRPTSAFLIRDFMSFTSLQLATSS
jgi:hypothetical protein